MPISYEKRRAILQKLKEQLHPELQELISDRNVKAALELPPRAQKTLAQAIVGGLRKQPVLIRCLMRDPDIPLDQLRRMVQGEAGPESGGQTDQPQEVGGEEKRHQYGRREAISILADHLLATGYVQNRIAAEALAKADFMAGVLRLVEAVELAREPRGADSETVTLALCALTNDLIKQLNKQMEENGAHKMTVLQSELSWSRWMVDNKKLGLPSEEKKQAGI